MVKSRGRSKEWLDTDDFAAIFGVSVTYFRDKIRPLVSGESVRKRDGKGTALEFHAPTMLRAWREQGIATARPVKPPDDPLLAGDGDGSPQLERYRAAKADLAELDVAKRRGEVADVSRLESYLRPGMNVVRNAIERLQREYGAGAYEIMEEAIGEAERLIGGLAEQYGGGERTEDDGAAGEQSGPVDPPGEITNDS